MAFKLIATRSSIPGKVPTLNDIDLGEVAINTADGKLFLKRRQTSGVESIVEVGANAVTATKLATTRKISLTGDATGMANFDGTADAVITVGLTPTGVAAGTYSKVIVDIKGRVLAGGGQINEDIVTALGYTPVNRAGDTMTGSLAASGFIGPLTGNASTATKLVTSRSIALSGDVTGSANFDGSSNATITATLAPSGVTAGTYSKVIVDAKGRVVGVESVSPADVIGSLGYTPVNRAGDTMTGALAVPSLSVTNTTAATSTGTGALVVAGGVGIGGALHLGGDLNVSGNLVINGTTTTVNSSTITVDDPIITLGGDTAPAVNDSKDRGIEYRWHDGTSAKIGFFGFDNSTGHFTFIPDATNTNEVFSGAKGTIDANLNGTVTGNASTASKLAVARTISLTGDASGSVAFDGSANATITATLTSSGVIAGTYNTVTVDSKGRVTQGSNAGYLTEESDTLATVTGRGSTTNTAVSITNSVASTSTGTGALVVSGGVGIGGNLNVGGTVTAAALVGPLTGNASTASKLNTARTIALSGDATGTASFDGSTNVTISATLAASGVAAGTYSKVVVDAKGRVVAGSDLSAADLKGETCVVANTSTTSVINDATKIWKLTVNSNTAITINIPSDSTYVTTLMVALVGDGSHTASFTVSGGNLVWDMGEALPMNTAAGKTTIYTFMRFPGSTTWFAGRAVYEV